MKKQKKVKKNIFWGINCRGRAPLNQRSFEQCSKKFGQCSKICAMFKNSMFELRWRPLKSFKLSHGQHHWRQYCPISSHLVSSLIGSQLVSSLKKLFVCPSLKEIEHLHMKFCKWSKQTKRCVIMSSPLSPLFGVQGVLAVQAL